MQDRHGLTDEQRAVLEPLLPDHAPRRGGRWVDHRPVVDGVLWRVRTRRSLARPAARLWALADRL